MHLTKKNDNYKKKIITFCFIFTVIVSPLGAQAEYLIAGDPVLSSATMAEDVLTLHKAFYSIENSYLPPWFFPEDTFLPKTGGILYRLGKTILLDNIIDHLFIVIQHEVFGHGARYREYGSWDNSYHISLFPPYGDGSGWARSGSFSKSISDYEHIIMTAAGNEANTILSHSLRLKWIERGKINYRETVLYSLAAQNISIYILLTRVYNRNHGDIVVYLDQINTLYAGTGAVLSTDDLVRCSLVNLLDPFQYFAIAAYFYSYLYQGEEEFTLPMFDLWGIHYLPAFHLILTPFGPEFYLDNYFTIDKILLYNYLRYGFPVFYSFYGIGFQIQNICITEFFHLNARIDVWNQPGFNYGSGSNLINSSGGWGFAVTTGAVFSFSEKAAVTAEIGYKTDGFLPGKPLNNGIIFSTGLVFQE